jgi:hypothetical protein
MSLINDALKRARDADRRRRSAPASTPLEPADPASQTQVDPMARPGCRRRPRPFTLVFLPLGQHRSPASPSSTRKRTRISHNNSADL